MRRYVLCMTALAVVVVLAACASKATGPEFTKEDSTAIKQLLQEFTAAYNAKDVAKIQGFFSGTASIMPANRSILSGPDGVKAYYQDRLTNEGGSDLAIDPTAIEGQGTLAYVVAKYTMNLKPADAPEPRHDRGKVLWVLKKLGGRWLFEYQIMSSDLPPVVATPPPATPTKK